MIFLVRLAIVVGHTTPQRLGGRTKITPISSHFGLCMILSRTMMLGHTDWACGRRVSGCAPTAPDAAVAGGRRAVGYVTSIERGKVGLGGRARTSPAGIGS